MVLKQDLIYQVMELKDHSQWEKTESIRFNLRLFEWRNN